MPQITMMATIATATGTGTPSTAPKPSTSPNSGGMPSTGTPPVMKSAMPAPTDCTPSVMMKGDTPKRATPTPFNTPMAVAASNPAPVPRGITKNAAFGKAVARDTMAVAEITEVSATEVPTARSKPPVTSTSIWPSETSTR